jgi:hypothetical protein
MLLKVNELQPPKQILNQAHDPPRQQVGLDIPIDAHPRFIKLTQLKPGATPGA